MMFAAICKIIESAFDEAVAIIKGQIKTLEQGVQLLLQKETLNEEELLSLITKCSETILGK